jgi:DHA1 family tetracycline resistance protein-like MFS transporter
MPPLLAAALVVFLEGLAFGVILPVLTPFTQQLGGNATWAGFLFAAATLPRVVFAPLWGRLSDRWGRRPTLAVIITGTTLASVLWALTLSLDGVVMSALVWLLVSRLLYGVFAAQSVLGMAVASDVSDPSRRAAAMGVLGAAFGLAFTLGPAIGGHFAETFGMVNVGWLAGGLQFASIFVVFGLLRETLPGDPARAADSDIFARPRSAVHLAAMPIIATLIAVGIISTAAYSVMFPTFPPLTEAWYGWNTDDVGFALSVFGLIGAFVQGGLIRPLARRIGNKGTAILGLALLVAGLFWVAIHPPTTAGLWGALSLMAVGTGLCVPTITALMSLSVNERDQGTVHGLNQSATSIGRTVGFLASGAIFEHISRSATYYTGGAAALLSLLMLLLIRPRQARPDGDKAIEATADESPA